MIENVSTAVVGESVEEEFKESEESYNPTIHEDIDEDEQMNTQLPVQATEAFISDSPPLTSSSNVSVKRQQFYKAIFRQ